MKYLLVPALLLCCTLLPGQGLFESAESAGKEDHGSLVDLSGYVRGSAYGGLGDYDLSSVFGEFALAARLDHKAAFLKAELRFRQGWQFDQFAGELEIREAFGGFRGEKLDVLLGNQIISWGRTDGFNPTNCITPVNYFLLTAEPDDQKLSNFMLRSRIRLHPRIELELIGIPVYRPSVYRYSLFDLGENVSFTDPIFPEISFENATAAARLDFELDRIGFSFSGFSGFEPYYGFDVTDIDLGTGVPLITNAAAAYRKNQLGADLALPLGPVIIRAEAAWMHTDGYDERMYVPNPDISYVAGLELHLGGIIGILQYVGKHIPGWSPLDEPVLSDPTDPLMLARYAMDLVIYESSLFNRRIFRQQEAYDHAASLTLRRSFAYEALHVELSGYYNFTSTEYLLRPRVSWQVNDALLASLGASWMAGPEEAIFEYAAPLMNGVFVELKVSF